jgi:hypothetical protein
MSQLLDSATIHAQIDELLLSGRAQTAWEAEEMFLDAHLADIVQLASQLGGEEFEQHEAVKLLMSNGSRGWEDELR